MVKWSLIALVFIIAVLPAGAAMSARRVVLMEQATNGGCGCAGILDPGMDSLFVRYGHEAIVCIRYNDDHPWAYDELYAYNPTQIDARIAYYPMPTMPTLVIDGELSERVCDANSLPEKFEERFTAPSPLIMTASGSMDLDSFYVDIRVIAEEDPGADTLKLRVAVVEDSVYYDAPNTKQYWTYTFRTMLPGIDGQAFTIAQGETLDFSLSVPLDPVWDASRVLAVAFVQNDDDKSVLQAATTVPRRQTWAGYYGGVCGDIVRSGYSATLTGTFVNLGSLRDTFDIEFTGQLPPDWNVYYDITGGESVAGDVALDPDSAAVITVKYDCGFDSGTAEATMTFTSLRDGAVERSLDFFTISGVCGLLVDDDGGNALEIFYEDALDSAGAVYGVWDRSIARPDSADLELADFVVWFTGQAAPTLDDTDCAAIGPYLDSGGNFCLTGQDIAYSMCDPTSSHYTTETKAFFETYMHATYVMPNANLFDLDGRAGDVISDGISVTIRGGDGADNQDFPDVIDAIAPAEVIFDYSDPAKHGGIRYEGGGTRLVYLSFGFEAIDNQHDRANLMSNIVAWLAPTASVDPGLTGPVRIACYPSPAVSFANISVAGAGGWQSLKIYDVQGRVVRDAGASEGRDFRWDLTDESGTRVSPGIYFVAVAASGSSATHKLMIVR
ncbi:MAG: Omp28-related outer membrane protein [bacterium]|jgi:hypothetical protein